MDAELLQRLREHSPREGRSVGVLVTIGVVAALTTGGLTAALWWQLAGDRSPRPTASALVPPRPQPATTSSTVPPVEEPEVRYEDGVLEFEGARYEFGQPGDVVVLGDWDCDGIATAVLYRPDTGWLHHFDRWAAPGEELLPTSSEHVGVGRMIRRMARAGGCDEVVVVR